MRQGFRLELGPCVVLIFGVIGSAAVAALLTGEGWLVMAGPLLLGLSVLAADAWYARLQGGLSPLSLYTVIWAATLVLACAIVALKDPSLLKLSILVLGWCSIRAIRKRWRSAHTLG